jgi:hypothetical protein
VNGGMTFCPPQVTTGSSGTPSSATAQGHA